MNKISLPVAELKPALVGLGKVVSRKVGQNILSGVKVERTSEGWVTLTGSDLENFVTVRLEQPSGGAPASIVIPFEDLQRTVKACGKDDHIEIERSTNNRAYIRYHIGPQLAETAVESLPTEDFPATPRLEGTHIPLPENLRLAIQEGLACSSSDSTRPILNGLYIDVSRPECHTLVGTDGRHMYCSNSFSLPLKESVIIPRNNFLGWRDFSRDGEWKLRVSKDDTGPGWLQVTSRRWSCISRPVEGTFPNWRHVLPAAADVSATVTIQPAATEGVIQLIEKMPCTDATNFQIGIELEEGKVFLLARAFGDGGTVRVEVPGASAIGENLLVHLNRQMFTKALEFGLNNIELINSTSPIRFVSGGRQMVVMPIRPENEPVRSPVAVSEPEPKQEEPAVKPIEIPGPVESAAAEPASPVVQRSPLEAAVAHVEAAKTTLRTAVSQLASVVDSLRTIQREQRVSERELQNVRATLRSLQNVRI